MAIEFPIEVTPDGQEPFRTVATSRDFRQLERINKQFVFTRDMEKPSMTVIYSVAWISAKRAGLFDGTQAEFEATCEVDVLAAEDVEVDPTQSAP